MRDRDRERRSGLGLGWGWGWGPGPQDDPGAARVSRTHGRSGAAPSVPAAAGRSCTRSAAMRGGTNSVLYEWEEAPRSLMGSSRCLPIAANTLCEAEVIYLHPCQKWVLIKLQNVCLGSQMRYVPSLECCSGMGHQSGMFNPRKGWTCRALCAVCGCRGTLAAGPAAESHSTHLLSLGNPGFGGPSLTPLVSPCSCRAAGQGTMLGTCKSPLLLLMVPSRNQILLWEASGVLFHLGKRS